MELSDAIRRAALFSETDLPSPPPGHPARRVEIEGVYVLLPSTHPFGIVFPERLDEGRVEHVVGAVREFLTAEGRKKAIWMVPEEAEPSNLAAQLLASRMALPRGVIGCSRPG